jgi:hypothetical protein
VNRDEIKNKIQQARELVGGSPEDPFVQIAFGEVLRVLLQEPSASTMGEVKLQQAKPVALPAQLSEFLAQLNITTHIDRIVAILYYQYHTGNELTTIAELEEAYSSARVRAPRNFSDVLAQCIRKGYAVEAKDRKDGKKAWQITSLGEKFVETELPKVGKV